MWKKLIISLIILAIAIPVVLADEDNFFSVRENFGPYEAVPGDNVVIEFTISNTDLVSPRDVRVFIDPCPVGWKCEEKTLSFDHSGIHAENLSVSIPKTASPKKYTLYIMLESEWQTRRGDDRVLLTLLSAKQTGTISYEEYLAKQEEAKSLPVPEPELFTEEEVGIEPAPVEEENDAVSEDISADAVVIEEPVPEPEPDNDVLPIINESEIAENVERLESSHQFVEYASIVLIVLLVFVAAGAYVTLKKE